MYIGIAYQQFQFLIGKVQPIKELIEKEEVLRVSIPYR